MLSAKITFLFTGAICCILFLNSSIASDKKEEMAIEASRVWLTLVDNGHYKESWKIAAEYFRNAISSGQWEQSLSAVRKPPGKVIERRLKSRGYRTTLPGAPDGEYVVIQYETSFMNKKSAIETVTPMREKDGKWRVSGYFIK